MNHIGGHILEMTDKVTTVEEGRNRIVKSLNNGTALEIFKQMLIKQNINERIANELCYGDATAVLPMSKHKIEIKSMTSGNTLANVYNFIRHYFLLI